MAESPSNGAPTGPPVDHLPPVEPPTAGFILQLFVIPALVVAVLIVVWLLFGQLAARHHDPTRYIQEIRSGSENVRWRNAHELANLILTEPALAQDAKLLGELGGLLQEELNRPEVDANLARYLATALGTFTIAKGATESGAPIDARAVLSSALAANRPLSVRVVAAESLARLAANVDQSRLTDTQSIEALIAASQDAEPELRQRAVFALGFTEGDAANAALVKALDDPDRFVRYNAANALAQRGDAASLPVVREMLSTPDLTEVLRAATEAETNSRVEDLQLAALGALENAAANGHLDFLQQLGPSLEALAKTRLDAVRLKAGDLQRRLGRD